MKGSVRVEPTCKRDESTADKHTRKSTKDPHEWGQGEQIREMLWLFKEFISYSRQRRQTGLNLEQSSQLQPRDRSVTLPLPRNQLTKQSLQIFISNLCKMVWSKAFFYFSNQQLNYQYIKIYSSEQILKNLVRLSERFHLTPVDFQTINLHLQRRLLDYQLAKYPVTLPQEVNRVLVNAVREVDYTDQPENDYLSSSGVVFRLRDSGEYNDLIMQVVNQVASRLDQKAGSASVYSRFQQKMQRLYAEALQEEYIRGQQCAQEGQNAENIQGGRLGRQLQRLRAQARQKHKLKVKQYTTYCVGRKLPQSFRPFTTQEIGSHHLRIDSPQLLRLLTKWCEQLQNKFTTPGYFQHYVQTLRLQNGKYLVLLLNQVRQELDQLMAQQYRHIRRELAELYKNNNFLQAELLSRQFQAPLHSQIERYEGIAAGYSSAVLSNLHSYILAYLNRLIHGLLTVADRFAKHPISNHFQRPSNINLITFQIDDLIRSRFSSGERQVLKIYNEIIKLCQSKHCKLIKVKNRLRKSTHDLIITLMYKNVICQVQLLVVNTKDKHSQHSNLFHQYLHQLKRSIFGPITELCSIWKSLDGRFAIYEKDCWLGEQKTTKEQHKCTIHSEFQSYYRPFICSHCNSHYYHNNFIRHHLKCNNCQYWLCARCQLEESDCRSLIAAAYKQQQVISHCNRVKKVRYLPQYGICIFIQSQQIRIQPFRKHQGKRRSVIIGVRDKNLYEIADVSGEEAKTKFKTEYLVFQLAQGLGRQLIRIQDQNVAQFLLAQQLRQAYRSNHQKLCLNYQALSDEQFLQLSKIGLPAQRLSLKRLQVIGNRLQTTSHLSSAFPGLRSLQLAKNTVAQYTQISRLQGLQELGLNQNRLKAIPPQICGLWNLKELSCCQNQLRELPQQLSKLHKLKILRLSGNHLQEMPKCITKLFYLNELDLRRNMIQELPASLGFLNQLQILDLSNNRIVEVHSDISKLQKLQILGLGHNQLAELPLALTLLTSLQRCKLEYNRIVEVPAAINRLHNLTHLDMSNNRLLEFPKIDGLSSLLQLQISHNMLQELADFCTSPLKILSCSHNRLRTLPNLEGLSFLQQLQAYDNNLTSLPNSISKLRLLQLLNLQNNQLTSIPQLRLQALKQLSIAQNRLQSFNNMDLINAQQIDLSNNSISSFTLNLLPCLKRLLIHHNSLSSLQLKNYPKLRYLQAGTNRLTQFPVLEQKNHIKALNLQHNMISVIPKQGKGLQSISQLNLSNNQIKSITNDIQYLINLKDRSLELSFNPLDKIEPSEFLLKKCTLQTLQFVDPSSKLQKKQKISQQLFSPQKSMLKQSVQ